MLEVLNERRLDYADLYFQSSYHESWVLEDRIIKDGSYNIDQGVGIRAVSGEKTWFAYADQITLNALHQSAQAARSIVREQGTGRVRTLGENVHRALYPQLNPLDSLSREEKLALLQRADSVARVGYNYFWQVLGACWPGVLLHEAVGHGLEGDFNRRGTSVFSGQMGKLVASELCTVVDDGTLEGRRGSLAMDDEGVAGQYNVLIENGVLKGYMQDKLNARLMGVAPTGNGRRESYAHLPMPRMTPICWRVNRRRKRLFPA